MLLQVSGGRKERRWSRRRAFLRGPSERAKRILFTLRGGIHRATGKERILQGTVRKELSRETGNERTRGTPGVNQKLESRVTGVEVGEGVPVSKLIPDCG